MGLLDSMQSILGQGMSGLGLGQQNTLGGGSAGGTGGPDWGRLLGPAVLGGLMGALMSNKSARKFGAGALMVGGGLALGGVLLNKYKESVRTARQAEPGAAPPARLSPPPERAARLVRALVFAAKSDGHIDADERRAIEDNLAKLALGADGEGLVREAMEQPLDPALLAEGVQNEEEALELYLLSRSVVNLDHFMERGYLDALARALRIPEEVCTEIETEVARQRP